MGKTIEITDLPQFVSEVSDNHYFRSERPLAAALLWAARKKDMDTVNRMMKLGDSPRQAIMNINHFLHKRKYGLMEIEFNEYGWSERPRWEKEEELEFRARGESSAENRVRLAMGKNGLWAWGYSYATRNNAGGSCSPNEYQEPLSKQDAIKAGIELLKKVHNNFIQSERSRNDSCNGSAVRRIGYSMEIIEQLNAYDRPRQMKLF